MTDRILCVDDDSNTLEGYKRRLRKEFELDTAVGPEEGFRMVTEQGPSPSWCPISKCRG